MTHIYPGSALLLLPSELPGVGKVVLVPAQGLWLARVFPESGKDIVSGSAFGECMAEAIAMSMREHILKQI